eukprot:IDg4298t1
MKNDRNAITTRQAAQVSSTVDHPKLNQPDPESIRLFLNLYDQYVEEVKSRARQLGLIHDVESYESLSEAALRNYLEGEAAESRETVTLSALDVIVRRELRMNMHNKDASSRMKGLFIDYHTVLRKHGLNWILTVNQKVAVQHVISAIQPYKLRKRLENDIQLAHHDLRKDFNGFFKHAKKVSDAFALVDNGMLNEETAG